MHYIYKANRHKAKKMLKLTEYIKKRTVYIILFHLSIYQPIYDYHANVKIIYKKDDSLEDSTTCL